MSLNINKNFGAISSGALMSLNKSQTAMGKSITRVSTGMRVNSPADDVSAYMTSRRIKSDSDGYNALYNGVQNSSVKLNAADSAVSSVLDILNAMKSKALEYNAAANDTEAQTALQTEYNNLKTVLNSALDFKYNDEKLLQGDGNSLSIYTSLGDVGESLATDAAKLDSSYTSNSNTAISSGNNKVGFYNATSNTGTFSYEGKVYSVASTTGVASGTRLAVSYNNEVVGYITTKGVFWKSDYANTTLGGTSYTFNVHSDTGGVSILNGNSGNYSADQAVGTYASDTNFANNHAGIIMDGKTYSFKTDSGFDLASNTAGALINDNKVVGYYDYNTGTGVLGININPESTDGKFTVSWNDIKSKVNSKGLVTDEALSDKSLEYLNGAIKNVTAEQANIGAGIGALEYASSFLQSYANIQDTAYTSITEADMAKEMTNYVKNNVLSQAAQAMIAQANQSMAQVLNLLQ